MLCPDSDSRKGLFCVFPKSIDSVAGFGLAKAQNMFVISLFSGLSGIGVVLFVVTVLGEEL